MQTSRFNIQEHSYATEFPLYSSPYPITFSPGAAVAVAPRLLWVGQGAPWPWKVMENRKGHGKVMENDDNVMEFLLLH